MTKAYHHGDLRNALLLEATRELEAAGPDGVSLRGLARTLGVSHAAPGHHFADRRALLAEIATQGYAVLADRLEAAIAKALENGPEEGGAAAVFYEAGLAYVDVALEHPQRFKLMFGGGFLNPALLNDNDCPERLRVESSRAYLALLKIARGAELSATDLPGHDEATDPTTYEVQVPEFATWALVHGAATLQIDGALGLGDDHATFRKLMAKTLIELSERGTGTLWRNTLASP